MQWDRVASTECEWQTDLQNTCNGAESHWLARDKQPGGLGVKKRDHSWPEERSIPKAALLNH